MGNFMSESVVGCNRQFIYLLNYFLVIFWGMNMGGFDLLEMYL